jgi:hypothetical protein
MLKRLLLVMMAVLLLADVGLSESFPEVEVQQPIFDFGEVLRGQSVKHTFVFKNSGDALLVVDRVKSTCGCTGVLLSEKNIPPGGEGTIKATFNSSRFRGHVEKRILLYSNDPSGRPVSFTMTGVVTLPVEINPSRISLGRVPVGQSRIETVVLTNNLEQPIKLVNLQATNTAFRAEVDERSLAGGETTELRLIAEPVPATVHLNGAIIIRFEPSNIAEVKLPVSGSVGAAK